MDEIDAPLPGILFREHERRFPSRGAPASRRMAGLPRIRVDAPFLGLHAKIPDKSEGADRVGQMTF